MLAKQGNKLETSCREMTELTTTRVMKFMTTVAPMATTMLVLPVVMVMAMAMVLVVISTTNHNPLYAQGVNTGYAIDDSPEGRAAIHLSTILSSVYTVREALNCARDEASRRVDTVCDGASTSTSTVWRSARLAHIGIYTNLAAQQENLARDEELPLISITQFDIALRVENLKPSGIGRNFTIPNGEKSITLYAFSDIQTAIYPTNILHVWVYKGMVAAEIPLNVGSASWRTYSSKIIEGTERGSWSVYIYHIKDGGGAQDATTKSLFGFYTTDTRSLNNDGSILSQGANIVRNNAKTATLLGTYSFTVD